jgi:hypothetical protein
MRRSPTFVAAFFLFVTLSRVAALATYATNQDWWGWAIAIGVGLSLFVTGYYVGRPGMFWYAGPLAFLMLIADLWMNEMEVILTVARLDLVAQTANFLDWDADTLERMMQGTILMLGALPTVSAFLFGVLQGGVYVKEPESEWAIEGKRLFAEVNRKVRIGIVRKIDGWLQGGNSFGKSNGPSRKKTASYRYPDLSGEEKAQIAVMETNQIKVKYPGISDKTAYNWQQDARKGK